jgi:hypothetical protein
MASAPPDLSSIEHGSAVVAKFVEHHNAVRLHGAIGFVTPNDMLAGRQREVWAERDRKLEAAGELRRQRRAQPNPSPHPGAALCQVGRRARCLV